MESIERLEVNIGLLERPLSLVKVGLASWECFSRTHVRIHCRPFLIRLLWNKPRKRSHLFLARPLVAALFIPFFVTELPKIFWARLLGGMHCLLVVTVSIGTIFNFLRRKLDAIRRAATDYSDRFADQNVQEKYLILQEKCSTAVSSGKPAENIKT